MASVTINKEADIFFWVLGIWYNISKWFFPETKKDKRNKEEGREGSIHLIILFSYFTSCKTKLFFVMVWQIINIPFFLIFIEFLIWRVFLKKEICGSPFTEILILYCVWLPLVPSLIFIFQIKINIFWFFSCRHTLSFWT